MCAVAPRTSSSHHLPHLDADLEKPARLVGRRVPDPVGQVGLAVDGIGAKRGLFRRQFRRPGDGRCAINEFNTGLMNPSEYETNYLMHMRPFLRVLILPAARYSFDGHTCDPSDRHYASLPVQKHQQYF